LHFLDKLPEQKRAGDPIRPGSRTHSVRIYSNPVQGLQVSRENKFAGDSVGGHRELPRGHGDDIPGIGSTGPVGTQKNDHLLSCEEAGLPFNPELGITDATADLANSHNLRALAGEVRDNPDTG